MKQRVLLKGKDAIDLLQRISSVDLKKSEFGKIQEGLILNPQGKILSYFQISLLNENDATVEFEDQFLELLEKYTFSEKFEIEKQEVTTSVTLSEKQRILALKPKQGQEFTGDGTTNPLDVNLKSAVADQKGCYPGQEVIEKIISLGSPAKRLCMVQTNDAHALVVPQTLQNAEGQDAGILTSFAEGMGLAILKKPYAAVGKELSVVDQAQKSLKFKVMKVPS